MPNDMFLSLDLNGDGVLSQDEFRSAQVKTFADADIDGNGYLTNEEFPTLMAALFPRAFSNGSRAATSHAVSDVRPVRSHSNAFNRFDENGDGLISREEFITQRMARFFSLDTDGNGKLTWDEFSNAKSERLERRGERTRRQ